MAQGSVSMSTSSAGVFYFEPPSRMQIVAKLDHIVRFSDFLLVIEGPEGSGKSVVIEQLARHLKQQQLRCCYLSLRKDTSLAHFLLGLVSGLGIDPELVPKPQQQVEALQELARTLDDAGEKFVILVDNPQYLDDQSTELLINLAASGYQSPSLVLATDEEGKSSLQGLNADKKLDGKIHYQLLEPFTEDETAEFISARYKAGSALTDKQLSVVYTQSEGYPGRVETVVESLFAGGKISKPEGGNGRAFPFPPLHLAGVAVVLLLIVIVSLWQFRESTEKQPEQLASSNSATVSVPLVVPIEVASDESESSALEQRLTIQEAKLEQVDEKEQASTSVQEVITEKPAEQAKVEPVVDSGPGSSVEEPVVTEKPAVVTLSKPAVSPVEKIVVPKEELVDTAGESGSGGAVQQSTQPDQEVVPVTDQLKASEVKVAAAKPKVEAEVEKVVEKAAPSVNQQVSNPSALRRDEELLGWPVNGYTLQMMGARSAKSAEQFIRTSSQPERMYYFLTTFKGAPWHVVVYGQYPNRNAANAAAKKLPPDLAKLKPWARSIQGVQADIKK